MNRNRHNPYSMIALALVAGIPLVAQSATGNLSGTVKDGTGKLLSGTKLVFESPALFQPRTVLTDAKGVYRAPLLPVGNYTIKVLKEGYLGQTLTGYRVGVGAELAQDFILKALSVQTEVVEVTASTGSVEAKAADRISYNMSAETIASLPVARNFAGAAALVPGVSMYDEYNGTVSIRGAGAEQTMYRVDGVDARSDALQGPMVNVIPDTIEDVAITTSTGNARFGRVTGGAATVTTKKGGNVFAGSVRSWFVRESWAAAKPVFGLPTWKQNEFTRDDSSRQVDFTASGPIWTDHIWFSLAYRTSPRLSSSITLPNPNPNSTHTMATYDRAYQAFDDLIYAGPGTQDAQYRDYTVSHMDARAVVQARTIRSKFEGNLTYGITSSHTISFQFVTEKRDSTNVAPLPSSTNALNTDFYGSRKTSREVYSLSYRGILSDHWFVEASGSSSEYKVHEFSGPEQNEVPIYTNISDGRDTGTRFYAGLLRSTAPLTDQFERNTRMEVNVTGYLDMLGSHTLDIGGEYFLAKKNPGTYFGNRMVQTAGYYKRPGSDNFDASAYVFPTVIWSQSLPGVNYWLAPLMTKYYGSGGSAKAPSRALWVNDSWTIKDRWVLMLGLRMNEHKIMDVQGAQIASSRNLEPRFQLKWDIRGTGVDTLAVSAYRQGASYSPNTLKDFLRDPANVTTKHGWRGYDGQQAFNVGPARGLKWVDYRTLIDPDNYSAVPYVYNDATQTSILHDFRPEIMNEYGLTYRRTWTDGYVSLGFTQRVYQNTPFTYSDYGWQSMVLVQDPSGNQAPPKWQVATHTARSGESAIFRSVEISWQENLSPRFSWGGSYSYAWAPENRPASTFQFASVRNSELNTRNLPPGVTWDPKGPSTNAHQANIYFTYIQPVGKKGRVSYSIIQNMSAKREGDYETYGILFTPRINPRDRTYNPDGYAVYDEYALGTPQKALTKQAFLEPYGHYKDTFDLRLTSFKVDWEIPLVSKLRLIGGLSLANLWNEHRVHTLGEIGVQQATSSSNGFQNFRHFYKWDNAPFNYGPGELYQGTENVLPPEGFPPGTTTPRGINVLDAKSSAEAGFSIGLKF